MNILVINSGSSSLKYQFFESGAHQPLCSGLVELIGHKQATITHRYFKQGKEHTLQLQQQVANHEAGIKLAIDLITRKDIAVVASPSAIQVTGHRVVHGGENFTKATVITPDLKDKIRALYPLAPLHNPIDYKGIIIAEKILPHAVHVAVFDTAFHSSLPEKAFRYALPPQFYKEDGIRVYGFHGISHQHVSQQAVSYLKKKRSRIITIHLGNGCSMAAVMNGVCIDTSMGLTPLDGLIMGTRCGAIDPSALLFLMEEKKFDAAQLTTLLNKQSGMLGLTGKSDMREIIDLINQGDEPARLAYEMYAYRIKKFIGAYTAVMNGLDAVVFTGGVGENDGKMRELVCNELDFFGITIDKKKNNKYVDGIWEINKAAGLVKVLVIKANEELEIVGQCRALLTEHKRR